MFCHLTFNARLDVFFNVGAHTRPKVPFLEFDHRGANSLMARYRRVVKLVKQSLPKLAVRDVQPSLFEILKPVLSLQISHSLASRHVVIRAFSI